MIEIRLKVPLVQAEYAALLKIATKQLRSPVDQLRYILREELDRQGLLERTVTDLDDIEDQSITRTQSHNRSDNNGLSKP